MKNHVGVLEKAGLVTAQKVGRVRTCRLGLSRLAEETAWIEELPTAVGLAFRRVYLVAGTLEPFFLDNATRWAVALRDAGADVVLSERVVSHGDALWQGEFPLMVAWALHRQYPRMGVHQGRGAATVEGA